MKLSHCIKSVIAVGSLAVALFISMPGLGTAPAVAAPVSSSHSLLAVSPTAKDLDRKAKSDVDSLVGAGTSDQLEGYTQQAKGLVQEKTGDLASQAEGIAEQVQGRAKTDIGQVKGAVEDATDAVEDKGETLIDNVKDFFD